MAKKQQSESRKNLRDLTLGRPRQFRRKTFFYYPPIFEKIENEDGTVEHDFVGYEDSPIELEVRQPTVRERNELIEQCKDQNGVFSEMEFTLMAVIHLVYDPDSGERLFDKHDYDALSNQPAGDMVDQFAEQAIKMLTAGQPEVDPGKKPKNKTAGTSSLNEDDTTKGSTS